MRKPAYFTGSGYAESIRASQAFVYQMDQIALVYTGQENSIIVCMKGSGKYQASLRSIQAVMEKSFATISRVAVAMAGSEFP
ncbi:hypothetical protein BGZ60DRAFT_404114 [Tricladium varicosporioides]|nr:hypothetical protein BGZ60DRAFT_404114 [Hymenoscyphus varicosporioides]